MRPSTKTNDATPVSKTTPATRNALVKECVLPTIMPVTIGATAPITLFAKFMMLPTVPTPPRGAISDGNDQLTGAAAPSPLRATEIHAIASTGSVVVVAPKTASPPHIPTTSTVL